MVEKVSKILQKLPENVTRHFAIFSKKEVVKFHTF